MSSASPLGCLQLEYAEQHAYSSFLRKAPYELSSWDTKDTQSSKICQLYTCNSHHNVHITIINSKWWILLIKVKTRKQFEVTFPPCYQSRYYHYLKKMHIHICMCCVFVGLVFVGTLLQPFSTFLSISLFLHFLQTCLTASDRKQLSVSILETLT